MEIRQIEYSDTIPFMVDGQLEGLAGFSKKAIYYGVFIAGNILVGISSIQKYSTKTKFNNAYILPEFRGNGYYKALIDYRLLIIDRKLPVVATCTEKSLKEWFKRGATVTKKWKKYTEIRLEL